MNFSEEPKYVPHSAERLLTCAILILHREKHISTWIAVGAELKFMCLPIGKLCLNVMRFLAGVMTNVGKMGMLTKIVY